MADWGDVEATSGFEDKVKINDVLDIIDKNDFKDTFKEYRFFGEVQPYQQIWLPLYKDSKPVLSAKKNEVRIPFFVTNYNLETHKIDEDKPACPYVEVAEKMNKYLGENDQLRIKQGYLAIAIDREAQENPPKKIHPPTKAELKSGFYIKDSPTTKFARVFDMTPTLFKQIKGLKDLNKHTNKKTQEKKTYNMTDPKFGCNVNIKFSPKEKGGSMYAAQKGERTPLTEEELEYLTWDIVSPIVVDDYKTAKKEADRLWKEFAKSLKGKKKDDDDDDDDDLPDDLEDDEDAKPSKKKNAKASSKKSRVIDDDDEDEDDVKPKKKSKSKVVDDDEDEDEDEKPTKKKKKPVDDDDDEDEDEKPAKKKGKVKKVIDDDDDDEDDDDPDVDLDDDDEDEKPAKKKKKSKVVDDDDDEDVKLAKKKKKPVDDDDDDDMESLPDDDDDDDDDEDEKPAKKSKKPLKKKKKPVDDDDDDDDD